MSTRKSIKKKPFEMDGPSAAAVLIISSLLWGVNFMDRQVLCF